MTQILGLSVSTADASGVGPVWQVRNPREVPRNLLVQAAFSTGSANGTNVFGYVQTSLDRTNWIDIAAFQFATASTSRVANLSALTPVTSVYSPTNAALSSTTVKDGILGSHYRVSWVSSGGYVGATMSINAEGLELIASGS